MDNVTIIGLLTTFVVSAVLIALGWDVRCKQADKSQSFLHALRHYGSLKAMWLLGVVMRRKLAKSSRNVQHAQAEFLMGRLKEDANTEYGRRYDFDTVSSVEEFIERHPLTRYDHYAPYVQRMMEGEVNVLSSKQPVIFGVSSGTSGEGSKVIPMVRRQQSVFFLHGVSVLYVCMMDAFPVDSRMLRKSLKIFYNPAWRTSKAGIPIGPNSSTPKTNKRILHMYTTPEVGYDIGSEPEALYVHLLFALKDRHLGSIEGNFASLIYNAMQTLHRSHRQLALDIATGTLNKQLDIDRDIRRHLETLLHPDPVRAQEVVEAFGEERGGVKGVCQRLWPELYIVLCVDTGAFAPYGERLRETFLHGVSIYSPLYAATEGLVGVNMWPRQRPTHYMLHPAVQFFEFIPVEQSDMDNPHTVLLHQVVKDREYEVVLTNVSGLYRYRLGDVVRVTGFHNQCPVVEFIYRIGQFLNVRGEKTCERMLYDALCGAVAQWSSLALVDYCCAESIIADDVINTDNGGAPCYHVFLELEGLQDTDTLSAEQKKMIDDFLCDTSYPYASFRKKGSIDVMRVHVVGRGTFAQFRHYVINNTDASSNQFKVPRVIKKKDYVQFLWERTLRS